MLVPQRRAAHAAREGRGPGGLRRRRQRLPPRERHRRSASCAPRPASAFATARRSARCASTSASSWTVATSPRQRAPRGLSPVAGAGVLISARHHLSRGLSQLQVRVRQNLPVRFGAASALVALVAAVFQPAAGAQELLIERTRGDRRWGGDHAVGRPHCRRARSRRCRGPAAARAGGQAPRRALAHAARGERFSPPGAGRPRMVEARLAAVTRACRLGRGAERRAHAAAASPRRGCERGCATTCASPRISTSDSRPPARRPRQTSRPTIAHTQPSSTRSGATAAEAMSTGARAACWRTAAATSSRTGSPTCAAGTDVVELPAAG